MTKKRKLSVGFLFDDTLDNDAGVAQYVKTLGAWLSSRGHRVTYMSGETKLKQWHGGSIHSMSRNLVVRFNGNRLSTPLPASKKTIERVLAVQNFDVVHVQTPHSPFMASRVLARIPKSTAIVSTFHILPNGWATKAGSVLLRLAYFGSLKRISKVFAVSAPAADFAKSFYGLDCNISPNMVDTSKFKVKSSKFQDNNANIKRVVFLGRLVERKGCMQLLKAFSLAASQDNQLRLIVAGDGSERAKLQEYTRSHGLDDKVTFAGYVDENDKAGLLSSADIAVFPSTGGESFGIVLLEAMAAGARCVLAGDNPGYRSVLGVKPELMVDVNNTAVFAQKLLSLPGDGDYQSWQKEYVQRFDVNVVGAQMEKTYYSLVK